MKIKKVPALIHAFITGGLIASVWLGSRVVVVHCTGWDSLLCQGILRSCTCLRIAGLLMIPGFRLLSPVPGLCALRFSPPIPGLGYSNNHILLPTLYQSPPLFPSSWGCVCPPLTEGPSMPPYPTLPLYTSLPPLCSFPFYCLEEKCFKELMG